MATRSGFAIAVQKNASRSREPSVLNHVAQLVSNRGRTERENLYSRRKAHGKTPAVAAGITDKALTMADVVAMIDARDEKLLADKRRAALDPIPRKIVLFKPRHYRCFT